MITMMNNAPITSINEACIDAVKLIKKICEDNGSGTDCSKCPFSRDAMSLSNPYICMITDLEPHNWKINKNTKFQALL